MTKKSKQKTVIDNIKDLKDFIEKVDATASLSIKNGEAIEMIQHRIELLEAFIDPESEMAMERPAKKYRCYT